MASGKFESGAVPDAAVLSALYGQAPGAALGGEATALLAELELDPVIGDELRDRRYIDELLQGTFRELADEHRPQRQAVLARIGDHTVGDAAASPGVSGNDWEAARSDRPGREEPRAKPLPFLGRHRRWLIAINLLAACLLVSVYAGYLSLMRVQHRAMAQNSSMEVKNVAIALRILSERRRGLPPSGSASVLVALTRSPNDAVQPMSSDALPEVEPDRLAAFESRVRDGDLLDAFDRPIVYRRDDPRYGRVYSVGVNGRDEGGEGDDLVAAVVYR